MLVPPPDPSWKPKNRGGMVGGFGVGSAMRTKFRPHPVCSLMLLVGIQERAGAADRRRKRGIGIRPDGHRVDAKVSLYPLQGYRRNLQWKCSGKYPRPRRSRKCRSRPRAPMAATRPAQSPEFRNCWRARCRVRFSIAKRFAISRLVNELSARQHQGNLGAGGNRRAPIRRRASFRTASSRLCTRWCSYRSRSRWE